jgi:uncharacterized membrane protein
MLPDRVVYPVRWWITVLLTVALVVWGGLFLAVALLDHRPGGAGHALSIAIGTQDPFDSVGADVPAVALAVLSWLLIPAVIGAVVALVLDEQLLRSRVPRSEAELELDRLRSLGAAKAVEAAGEKAASP